MPGSAQRLAALLDRHGRDFVEAAYRELLGRAADPAGCDHFLGRLRSGDAKLHILGDIAGSPEARARGVSLPGLAAASRRERAARLPFVGRALARLLGVEGDGPAARRVRALEQRFGEMSAGIEAALARLEAAVANLEGARGDAASDPGATRGADARLPFVARRGLPPFTARHVHVYVGHTARYPLCTGVQRVTRCLALALARAHQRVRLVDWDAVRGALVALGPAEAASLMGVPAEALPVAWRDAQAMAVEPVPGDWLVVPEVTHITFHAAPVTAALLDAARRADLRAAFLFYDATPLCRPELAAMAPAHEQYMSLLGLADLVVPISAHAAADFAAFHRLHEGGDDVTLPALAVQHLPAQSPAAGDARPAAPPSTERLVLAVGSITRHKNQLALIEAFERVCSAQSRQDWRLVLIGGVDAGMEDALRRALETARRTTLLRSPDDAVLQAHYRACAFTVFPSVEEGYGLPIVESLWHGRPCLCADFGAMAELARGGGCLTVDMRERASLEGGLARLIDDAALRARLREEAVARPLAGWEEYARALLGRMERAASAAAALGTVYYWVDHTVQYDGHTGIQRVVRALARALLADGATLVPVRWGAVRQCLEPVPAQELAHLARWNGPAPEDWAPWPAQGPQGGWLLVPELTSRLDQAAGDALEAWRRARGLRRAQVFFDAIPLKHPDQHAPETVAAHAAYMRRLGECDLVFAISTQACADLAGFIEGERVRVAGLFERFLPCPLPGEFPGSARATRAPAAHAGPLRILCVGSIEPRKNHLALIEAFAMLEDSGRAEAELWIAGRPVAAGLAEHIAARIAGRPRVRWIEAPDDAQLRDLYETCDFTVYASYEEGFGLPILESLWHGRPCLCASFGAMAEVAADGGCLTTDVRDATQLAHAMERLCVDTQLRAELCAQALRRPVRTWGDYAADLAAHMAALHRARAPVSALPDLAAADFRQRFCNLAERPILSLCVSTYNRAAWLEACLRAIEAAWPAPDARVEILVCDNASTDATPQVSAAAAARRADLRVIRNADNVGMLGNLRVTAQAARGRHVWIIGDDDIVLPGAVEAVLAACAAEAPPALAYLNYAITREAEPAAAADLAAYAARAEPVVAAGPDVRATVREICANSENFFTAIYCVVFRRDHALRAYSQATGGAPFATMAAAIPTTLHVLGAMMDEPATWVGRPALVANMNVSWSRHAPLFVLERLPEARDLAERMGGDRARIDHWRREACPLMLRFFGIAFDPDCEVDWTHLSVRRILSRLRGLQGADSYVAAMRDLYAAAHAAGHPAAREPVERMFAGLLPVAAT